ncbi:hypothetical protein CC1G_04815 [Coprinopsis cinerea okayama7|uniref:Uncharacterized protein n=1 Tax=Coprinopsis cinerea (strain Okayama-7 / 130 / ATCC MYA-4618 / FGSC 9003) TaxID=240176 RepID=A8P2N7_COPC7|nr:hypothetical protein CC1G_04815 [Coprinopsis cinerea okayama7\|eukprot:XP_001838371.2 hypothetical protein CC1G_04815 [Coprinopsis cinerea okayama7\
MASSLGLFADFAFVVADFTIHSCQAHLLPLPDNGFSFLVLELNSLLDSPKIVFALSSRVHVPRHPLMIKPNTVIASPLPGTPPVIFPKIVFALSSRVHVPRHQLMIKPNTVIASPLPANANSPVQTSRGVARDRKWLLALSLSTLIDVSTRTLSVLLRAKRPLHFLKRYNFAFVSSTTETRNDGINFAPVHDHPSVHEQLPGYVSR